MRTLLLAAGLLVPWGAASAETVTILHTNDIHGQVLALRDAEHPSELAHVTTLTKPYVLAEIRDMAVAG